VRRGVPVRPEVAGGRGGPVVRAVPGGLLAPVLPAAHGAAPERVLWAAEEAEAVPCRAVVSGFRRRQLWARWVPGQRPAELRPLPASVAQAASEVASV
jgi:hypothetical protein